MKANENNILEISDSPNLENVSIVESGNKKNNVKTEIIKYVGTVFLNEIFNFVINFDIRQRIVFTYKYIMVIKKSNNYL